MSATLVSSATSIPGAYWSWREQPIYYVRAGQQHSERPPLLLIHGFGGSTDHWRKNIAGLCKDYEVWAIDLLGFGRSAKPNWQYSGDLWRDQLHDFITEAIGQPAVLAGNSLGGYAGLCVAAQCPDSAKGLILINSAGPFTEIEPQPQPDLVRKIWGEIMLSILRQPWANYLLFQYLRQRSVIRKTLEKLYLDQSAVTDDLVEDIYRPSCDPGAPQVFASVFSTPQGEKVDVLLKQLICPLLLIWGEADPWMNVKERGVKFRKFYPELTEYYLRAGHCPHDEVPEQVNTLISEWVLGNCKF
ncbi:alpha/beta fold hydrolase [Aerosakkonema funiforme]|uniref:Alpha/beta fold hydrolase n=1 Tax=Aerosakkonema funiforme FACHB-1375 TaxID=2949571 RepID=A0A926ZG84_9CYAN|nr:alpha/beta fold hydrolase [Aerosakkonema funiforme]MBD2181464.1 alpha/beta fold hydrolase [Aerosakkonema funiforme FACHB-1375]